MVAMWLEVMLKVAIHPMPTHCFYVVSRSRNLQDARDQQRDKDRLWSQHVRVDRTSEDVATQDCTGRFGESLGGRPTAITGILGRGLSLGMSRQLGQGSLSACLPEAQSPF